MIGHVYSLECAKSGEIFYIGCTSIELNKRLSGHKSAIKLLDSNVYEYIREKNIEIKLEAIERINYRNKNTLLSAEEFWIEQFRQWGFPLKNIGNFNPRKTKKRNPLGSGSLCVDPDILSEAKDFCKKTGRFLYGFVNDALKEKLLKSK